MAYSGIGPVAEAVFGVLVADATLAATATGGVYGLLPQGVSYPCVWIEVFDERDSRGFGTGGVPEITVRTHAFSQYGSMSEAQDTNRLVVGLLKDAAVTITGYTQAGRIVYRETIVLPDEELAGVRVHEVVSNFTAWAQEA